MVERLTVVGYAQNEKGNNGLETVLEITEIFRQTLEILS